MSNRRKFLHSSLLGSIGLFLTRKAGAAPAAGSPTLGSGGSVISEPVTGHPVVISTWDTGLVANKGAWEGLSHNGSALDAVEAGVKGTESSINFRVGLGANPDRDGFVTLDASIMDHQFNCGAVAFLERIKHPISVARRVMEKTPHVMLVGAVDQEVSIGEGFPLGDGKLAEDGKKSYEQGLKESGYKPVIKIEKTK